MVFLENRDTGGRDLIFSVSLVYSQDELSFEKADTIPGVFLNLLGVVDAPNFKKEFYNPIEVAKVSSLTGEDISVKVKPSPTRYTGTTKPVYVEADILNSHLNKGESTSEYRELAKIIRNRGLPDKDDCGHIIARHSGGKMIDYNLFPQDLNINRGWRGWSRIWKCGAEIFASTFLMANIGYDPMVRVRVLLIYPPGPDNPKPDRPTGFFCHFQFYRKKRRKEKEESPDEKDANASAMRFFLRAAASVELSNECVGMNLAEVSSSVTAFCKALRKLQAVIIYTDVRLILQTFVEELNTFVNPKQEQSENPTSSGTPRVTPMSCNKPFSLWDLVPIVGSIRTLDDAIRCSNQGDKTGFAVNYTLGVVGLVVDGFTLGSAGLLVKGLSEATKQGTKVVVKTGTQEILKSAFMDATKEGIKVVAKTGTQEIAKTALKEGVKQGTKFVVEKAVIFAVERAILLGVESLAQTAVTQAFRRSIERIVERTSSD